MSSTETWTVGRLLTWTADYLKKSGSASPRLDAEVLLAHARGCQRIELYTAYDEEPSEEVRGAFRQMVKRRADGAPVAYLVGYKEFYSTVFEVTPDVLIPRPETEHLVVEALDCVKQLSSTHPPLSIADVGTGSGAIAVSVAKHCPGCHVTAIDVSPAALEISKRNAARYGLGEDRIEFLVSDLFEQVPADREFDLILSNPPYVSPAEYEQLPKSVKDFEPKLALVSEPDGTTAIRQLIEQSCSRLKPHGSLIFEFSPMLAPKLGDMISHASKWSEPTISKDLAGHARIVTLRRK